MTLRWIGSRKRRPQPQPTTTVPTATLPEPVATEPIRERVLAVLDRRRAGLTTRDSYLPRHAQETSFGGEATWGARTLLDAELRRQRVARAGTLATSGYYRHVGPEPRHLLDGEPRAFNLTDLDALLDGAPAR